MGNGVYLQFNKIRGVTKIKLMSNQPSSHLWRLGLRERRFFLLVGDFLLASGALFVALYVWASNGEWLGFTLAFLQERVEAWFYVLPVIWLLLMVELYDPHRAANRKHVIRGIIAATSIGFMFYLVVYFAANSPLPRRGVATFLGLVSILTLIWRLIYIQIFTTSQFMRRVLLVGAGHSGEMILRVINDLSPKPFELVGVIDDDPEKDGMQIEGYTMLGDSTQLLALIDSEKISDIIVAISGEMQGSTFQMILDAQERGVEITRMPIAYEELVERVPITMLDSDWILRSFVDEFRISGVYEVLKRLMDILGGLAGVVILLFFLPWITFATLIDDGFPIFYFQERLGKGARPYKMIKFRTMRKNAEKGGIPQLAAEDDHRATRVGRILRKTHLDELPQFINVLRGEMSLVGPRAERIVFVEKFQRKIPFYRARLLVKPGVTGWAQVNFGYAATTDETLHKLEYDLYYIKHRSFLLDILIILRTPATMLGMKGQ